MANPHEVNRPFEILIVEDNMGDVYLMRLGFETVSVRVHLTVVEDGDSAIRYLLNGKHEAAHPRPDLILLDLNLPKKSGFEVLAAIRDHPETALVPVLVLSSSEAPKDIRRAYELRANGFIHKPASVEDLKKIITGLETFWLTVVMLPSR